MKKSKMISDNLTLESFVSHVALNKAAVKPFKLELVKANVDLKSRSSNLERAESYYEAHGLEIKEIVDKVLLGKSPGASNLDDLLKKSDGIAELFKNLGNDRYRQRKLSEALRCYTLACCYAPVGSKVLALAFSNRSACFVELKSPKLALQDIRLFEANASRSTDPIDASILAKVNERKKKVLDRCKEELEADELSSFFKLKNPSTSVPSAESFIGIVNDEVRGRHVRNIGTNVIKPGTMIILEEPFSKIVLGNYKFELLHCVGCLKDLRGGGIPCEGCVFHVFCSPTCATTHSVFECQIAHCLYLLDLSRTQYLALTTLLRLSPSNLLKESCTHSYPLPGFTNSVYKSSSYHAIYNLMWHEQIITESNLQNYLTISVLIFQLLQDLTSYFQNSSKLEQMNFIASLLRHMLNFPCNAHSLYKINQHHDSYEVGAAAFALLSMINHSCDPNVVRATLPNGLNCVIALQEIAPGQEILDNYGFHYAMMGKKQRMMELKSHYNFICNCDACEGNWPGIKELNLVEDCDGVKICWKCKRNLESSNNGTLRCGSCGFDVLETKWMDEYGVNLDFEQRLYDSIKAGQDPERLFFESARALEYFDSRFKRPFKYISACQEMMKQSLLLWIRHYF